MIDQNIEKQAFDLLQRHHATFPPIQVEAMAWNEGIQVARTVSQGEESGFLLRDSQRTLIGLNASNSPNRQRFTIAHELGHWLLHKGKPLIVDHAVRINKRNNLSSTATDREEIEANAFAAALLMPAAMLYTELNKEVAAGNNTVDRLIDRLASTFEVSSDAMRYRLANLGIIT